MKSLGQPKKLIAIGGLIAVSLFFPWTLEKLFSIANEKAARPSEIMAFPPSEPALTDSERRRRTQDNERWINEALASASIGISDAEGLVQPSAPDGPMAEEAAIAPHGLSPGLLALYDTSWDSLKTRRQDAGAGFFLYPARRTRLQATLHRLKFRDPADRLAGRAARLDLDHEISPRFRLREGISAIHYDGLHDSLNGYLQAQWSPAERLYTSLACAHEDVWERLATIRGELRVFSVSPYVFMAITPRVWAEGGYSFKDYNDGNLGQNLLGELGYVLSRRWGLSASAGVETVRFRRDRPGYWTPSHYRLIFGRLRWSKNYDEDPFGPVRSGSQDKAKRLGYLAEYTGGVNDDGDFEHTLRAGIAWQAKKNLSVRAEASHFGSPARFGASYSEKRLVGKIVYSF